jgi:hypothetical protein
MIRIAAVADLHLDESRRGQVASRLRGVAEHADLLLLPGDLTDHGSMEEAEWLAEELGGLDLPILAVLGNHDYVARRTGEISAYLSGKGIRVLDGETVELTIRGESLGVVGVRGFRGGFGEYAFGDDTEPEGEAWVKLVHSEAGKLEAGLRSLSASYRIVMMHYAPIRETVIGEHPETFAFYGSSALCKPVDRHRADLVVHGHSHHGTHQGATPSGVPVYNVSVKVIGKLGMSYALLEVGG